MKKNNELRQQLFNHLNQNACSFSIGSFGAIAEFHRLPADAPQVDEDQTSLESITAEGAIRIQHDQPLQAVAYEIPGKQRHLWRQGVAFCLPEAQASLSQRQTITELGADSQAIQAQHRHHRLFDLGVGAKNIDFCIRTDDAGLLEALRRHIGQSFFDIDSQVREQVLDLSPHRVVVSKAGRIEVYQPIGREKTPEGSHTHLLPKLLATGRTHSANVPLPEGCMPVLQMYPDSALKEDAEGHASFDHKAFEHFQNLLNQWGRKAYVDEKQRVTEWILAGKNPETYRMASDRYVRTAVRVVIRQMHYLYPQLDNLQRWNQFFNVTS